MTNLRPEKRLDKTGKLVTRHVKDDGGNPTTVPQLPPPSASPEPVHKIVLPETVATPMTKDDWGTVSDVLDICGTHNSDDLAYVSPYIREGDMDALRLFQKFSAAHGFSTVVDVIELTHTLDKPADYMESMSAHMMIAASGHFDYFDIAGVPEHESVLKIIHENAEQAGSILNFLKRGSADPEALKSYLANETKALREGTL
jgi:hypothetical protein